MTQINIPKQWVDASFGVCVGISNQNCTLTAVSDANCDIPSFVCVSKGHWRMVETLSLVLSSSRQINGAYTFWIYQEWRPDTRGTTFVLFLFLCTSQILSTGIFFFSVFFKTSGKKTFWKCVQIYTCQYLFWRKCNGKGEMEHHI